MSVSQDSIGLAAAGADGSGRDSGSPLPWALRLGFGSTR